jgi:subtilisin-like proprotein convertase family protein
MKKSIRWWSTAFAAVLTLVLVSTSAVVAFQVRPKTSRFDTKVIEDPTTSIDVVTTGLNELPAASSLRTAWEGFRVANGPWTVHLDRRSGAPLLVEGQGIRFPLEQGATVESIGTGLRSFLAANRGLLKAEDNELVLDNDASGPLTPDVWQIVFNRMIAGVPVVGEKYVFTVGHGNLISFGTPRWSRIDASPFPTIDSGEAIGRLTTHMGLALNDNVNMVDKGTLQLIPLKAMSMVGGPYDGPVGAGFTSALVWRVALTVDGEPGTWAALVDAHTGEIRSFNDINDYAQAKGGVYPVSNDGTPPDGDEHANWPMPYANVTINAATQFTSSSGLFSCTPGGSNAQTTLAGQFVRVVDTCGPLNFSVTCDSDLNLGTSPGTDCVTPGFGGAGNTHASRTGFYHLNRIAEHARVWLPSRTWLTQQLTDNVNLNQTCNAYWNGTSVNFFKSGGGCRNTGEIAGVFLHEWGHGLDSNDGGGSDNPGEAYADITAIMSTHVSCVGRGFDMTSNCGGYGDACLNCTGIRDQDWNQHNSHAPATPSGFLTTFCPGGAGPCGKEVHCESYVGAETLWDLATRDFPASGLDLASSWQIADKLWYKSRLGSGGNAYNCALPNSDGCAATSWFSKLRAIDDDDGNLANGTPHAAAIFAAFNRHKIACGLAGDASNQNTSSCPAIGAATLSSLAGSGSAQLNWTAVANATGYNVLRNDASCDAGSTIIATLPAGTTTYTDSGLANGFAEYYRVQAIGANQACDGLLSNCQTVTPQPFAGVVKFDRSTYSCSGVINVTVTDGNIAGATATVAITSGTEPGGETITVTQVGGSADYVGSINTTAAPAAADGYISVANGDTITGTYIDADDGIGGVNLTRITTAGADCVFPIISNVQSSLVTGNSARITWDTNEASNSTVHYGLAPPPPGSAASVAAPVLSHVVDLTSLQECSTYVYSAESADAVGNTALDNAGGAYYTFNTLKNTAPNYVSTDTPVAIPDNNPTGATSTINVADNKPVVSVKVTLNITHTYDGDLILTLQPPAGAAITLFNRNPNTSSDNFINTVFDDTAATSITTGAAPFTGSFRPVSPLSAAAGINAAGAWKLKVVDAAGIDVGTINNWTLSLVYPAAACGPHALVQSNANVADTCGTGGAGDGDGKWDAGEQVSFKVNLNNDGTTTLTNVTATITSSTPGVVMTDGTASYPSIPSGSAADSIAPHFTAYLPTSLPCNTNVAFNVTINSDQGTWNGTFSRKTGVLVFVPGNALTENFSAGIPATWTIVNGGSGGGAAQTWTTANPGARSIAAPMSAPVAIVDSDNAGSTTGITQDEELITPVLDLTAAATATVQFDQFFRWYSAGQAEVADVDVRSSATGNAWVNVLRQQGASSAEPDHKTIDITAQAAGAANVQVRFHYYNGHFEWYWMIDNIKVDHVSAGTCNQAVCAAPAGVAKPVADGSFGTPMTGSRADALASSIALTWDVSTCSSTDHHVLYGDLANVSLSIVSGSYCDLGTSGNSLWTGVPAGDLWFVVVGDDDVSKEGSWGLMTAGERGGSSPSNQCGMLSRDNSGTCP